MIHFIQTLISGLSLGSIYALIALGYTMVYGIAKMLNFAHGDIIMIGAYAGIVAVAQLGLPPVLAVVLSVLVCVLLGVLIEHLAYKPLRQAPSLSVLITAIGVSYLLQNLALLIFGSQQKAYPTILTLPTLQLGPVSIEGVTILTLVTTAVIMLALTFFVNKTKLGKAMRAVSEDKEAAVFGGIGSIPGAMLGGILLGLIEQFSKTYISTLWADAIVFAVLVLVLVVKPTGLLGKKMNEKV